MFAYEGIPPTGQLIPLGLQHVVAAVVGVITPALIISGSEVCNLSAGEKTILIQASLIISEEEFTMRKSTVVGLSVALGVGITQVPGCLSGNGFPDWVATVFSSTAVVVAAIMAILLNLILPRDREN